MVHTYLQVQTTVSSQEDAKKLARTVLQQRLAGCVQISECRSCYHWQGRIEEDREYLLSMKTRQDYWERLRICVRAHHPYEVPEIIAIPIVAGEELYLQWLDSELEIPKEV